MPRFPDPPPPFHCRVIRGYRLESGRALCSPVEVCEPSHWPASCMPPSDVDPIRVTEATD
jgi:hypothetical protein